MRKPSLTVNVLLPASLAVAVLASGNLFAQTAAAVVAPFSASKPGAAFPPGWQPLKLGPKKLTDYRFVEEDGTVILVARADGAASGYLHPVKVDVNNAPVIRFRWKISQLIDGADNAVASKEDSPVRIILNFDGDLSRLTFKEKTASVLAKTASGRELPYAQLMYVWSNAAPVGSVIHSTHTGRVRMIVAASGSAQVGQWVEISRNVADDFRRAFGEAPGLLTDVGILTDTDNTGASVEGRYGDIRFTAP